MSNRWTKVVPLALALPLIIVGCGPSGPQMDLRSYDAGYHSAGPTLVSQGIAATVACQQALQAAELFMVDDPENYDSMSFNSGCYTAIHDNGDPVKNADGVAVPGFS